MSNYTDLAIIGTENNTGLDAEQQLFYGTGNLALWFDPSETQNYLIRPGPSLQTRKVVLFAEKAQTAHTTPATMMPEEGGPPYSQGVGVDWDNFCRRGVYAGTTYFCLETNLAENVEITAGIELLNDTTHELGDFTASAVLSKMPYGTFWLFSDSNLISDYTNINDGPADFAPYRQSEALANMGDWRNSAWNNTDTSGVFLYTDEASRLAGTCHIGLALGQDRKTFLIAKDVPIPPGKFIFSVRSEDVTVEGGASRRRLTAYFNENPVGYLECLLKDTGGDAGDYSYSGPNIDSITDPTYAGEVQASLDYFVNRIASFGSDAFDTAGALASPSELANNSASFYGPTGYSLGDVLFYRGSVPTQNFLTLVNYLKVKWFSPRPVFGALDNNIGIVSQAYASTFELRYASTVTLTIQATTLDENGDIVPVGGNWEATPVSSTQWSISGQMPSFKTSFLVKLHAGPDPYFGADQTYRLIISADGTLTAEQELLYGFGTSLAVWLDPAEATTLRRLQNDDLGGIYDRATTYAWEITSSETVTPDTTSFSVPGISFSDVEYADGFATRIALKKWSCDPLYQTFIEQEVSFRGVPLGVDDRGEFQGSTLFMVLSVETPNAFETTKRFGAFDNVDFERFERWDDGHWWDDINPRRLGAWITRIDASSVGGGATSIINTSFKDVNYSGDAYLPAYLTNSPDQGLLPPTRAIVAFRIGAVQNDGSYIVTLRYNGVQQTLKYYCNGPNVEATVNGITTADDRFIPPSSLGILGSPDGYILGSMGEVIAIAEPLSDAQMHEIELYLKHKWFDAVLNPPVIGNPSKNAAFASGIYDATVSISNGTGDFTTATVSSPSGSNWVISKVTPTDETLWRITGFAPAMPGAFTLTITGTIDGLTTTKNVVLTALAKPPMPEFGTLRPSQAATGVQYNGTLTIENMTTLGSSGVSIVSSAGSGWTIEVDPLDPIKYHVHGTMPSSAGTFNLTITAVNTNAENTIATTAQGVFPIHAVRIQTPRSSRYPLDLTGLLPSNKIKDEEHTLSAINGADRQMIVPILAPFFGESLVVKYYDASVAPKTAILHLDYVPVCEFQQLSAMCQTPVYGAVGFLNSSIEGRVVITYQTIGGDFVIDRNKLYRELATQIANPRQIDMSAVVDLPAYLPVDAHEHDFNTDLVGLSSAVTLLGEVSEISVIKQTPIDVGYMEAHVTERGNVHNVQPAQVGLGNVNNFPPATIDQASDPTNDSTYLTPMTASASGKANLRNASATVSGIAPLNLGNQAGDANNATDALTAAGALALMTAPGSNAFKQEFSGGQVVARVTPYATTPTVVTRKRLFNTSDDVTKPVIVTETDVARMHFPLYWRGLRFTSLAEFISGVETFVDIYPLTFDENIGAFYFPQGSSPPDLSTSSTKNVLTYRKKSVSDPVSYPLSVPLTTGNATEVVTTTVLRRITVVDPVTSKLIITETINT